MKQVCIQGLGFVGVAMAIALSNVKTAKGKPMYFVTGIDLPTEQGLKRIDAVNQGKLPFNTADQKMATAFFAAMKTGNLVATTDESSYTSADFVIVDVPLDVALVDGEIQLDLSGFGNAIRTVASNIKSGALILVETTVPPGTCEKIVWPIICEELEKRNVDKGLVYLAHSFERVMPGIGYYDSLVNYWRVYAGRTNCAADICEEFLSTLINVDQYPLKRLASMTASEATKVLENSYRAVNIAFIDEWTKYSELIGIDLYEIVDAVRVRPTHSNIRSPGLGVGGYCLTKDPLFALASLGSLFNIDGPEFVFSKMAIEVNQQMPLHAVQRLSDLMNNELEKKNILIMGVSYKGDIGDSRFSPSELLVRTLKERGAHVTCFDPFLSYWSEMEQPLLSEFPNANQYDAVVFATAHSQFYELDIMSWLKGNHLVVLDAVNVISESQRRLCRESGVVVETIGRGSGL
mgnify:CR=1 FL=1